MKKLFPFLLFIFQSAVGQVVTKQPTPFIRPSLLPHKPIATAPAPAPIIIISDTTHQLVSVSVKDFGAIGDGQHDEIAAFELARDYAITHPIVITVPAGNYFISRPFLMQNIVGGIQKYFTIHLRGTLPNKSASDQYLSKIICGFKSGYGIGIQYGRSITIENLTIIGQYTLPYSITNINIGVLRFADWNDPTITDTRYNPYAAISIDPNANTGTTTRGGTSDVTVRNCNMSQWMVGAALSANGYTQNAEMINFIDDQIQACRVGIAVCQDQSKTIKISGLKVWTSCYTVLDGLRYGAGSGGGSVFCENWNIAGNCKELFNLSTGRFPLSCKDIYSESLFRIGNVGSGAGANMINTEIDFLSGDGMPEADWLMQGQINFYGGMLRYYDSDYGHRLNLATTGFVRYGFMFRDMCFNNYPITQGLYGIPTNYWFPARFDNITSFYTRFDGDTLFQVAASSYTVDRTKWTATLIGQTNAAVGDYILVEPTAQTTYYWDSVGYCVTKIAGRVASISGDTLFLKNVPVNMSTGTPISRMYISRLKP